MSVLQEIDSLLIRRAHIMDCESLPMIEMTKFRMAAKYYQIPLEIFFLISDILVPNVLNFPSIHHQNVIMAAQ